MNQARWKSAGIQVIDLVLSFFFFVLSPKICEKKKKRQVHLSYFIYLRWSTAQILHLIKTESTWLYFIACDIFLTIILAVRLNNSPSLTFMFLHHEVDSVIRFSGGPYLTVPSHFSHLDASFKWKSKFFYFPSLVRLSAVQTFRSDYGNSSEV